MDQEIIIGSGLRWLTTQAGVPGPQCEIYQLNKELDRIRIDASRFCRSHGVNVEESTERQGFNAGFFDEGDWLSWEVDVEVGGTYIASYRIASVDGGAFELATESQLLSTVKSLPKTDGWQSWVTIQERVEIAAGTKALIVSVKSGGWNLAWIELKRSSNLSLRAQPTGYVRAAGKHLVDPNGRPLHFRGMGIGNWMLQEPYMMLAEPAVAQWQMFEQVANLIGEENLATYRKAWLDNFFTLEDVQAIKQAGFNSIRIPLHYNLFTLPIEKELIVGKDTWIQDGFDRLDQVIKWCTAEKIYVIPVLHAAPGGQGTDSKISDYDSSKPSLWEDKENVRKAIALWQRVAERYANATWVAGYDLLNEPNWQFETANTLSTSTTFKFLNVPTWDFHKSTNTNGCTDIYNLPLRSFYEQAIAAIRKVDQNHAIFIEGNCWGNNHNGLWPLEDDNAVLSFHRYWVDNTLESVQEYIDLRDEYNIPLWMGESGENDNNWYKSAVELLEVNQIPWHWWTIKKLQSTSSSFSIYPPSGYQTLLHHWKNSNSTKPDPAFSFQVMLQVAEATRIRNAFPNHHTMKSLTGRSTNCTSSASIAVKSRTRIEAEDACSVSNATNEITEDIGGGLNVFWLEPSGWLAYKINVATAGTYQARYRVSSLGGGGIFQVELNLVNGTKAGKTQNPPVTGGWQNFTTIEETIKLPQGEYELVIRALAGGWNLNWVELAPVI
ncbi:hypothetical protein FisN_23Lh173 [Fistulifera solaris]|uniref:CBM6 domain-containing protein n=1 Tax=Fistulifera solaris TaxID=1519565 RepID=A0A1Z5K4P8_FISSO|nr:hypothetical protein FisN_23Lh173 [Fistulifera solaris]|eukprot:GAX21227.1 hypothetical protein FisN_23Lh173 [Fistulifera solaris]